MKNDSIRASRVLSAIVLLLVAVGYSASSNAEPDRLSTLKEGEPVYLDGVWFHSGPDLNIVKRPDGSQQAVDIDGRLIADGTAFPPRSSIGRSAFHSLRKLAGEYYICRSGLHAALCGQRACS